MPVWNTGAGSCSACKIAEQLWNVKSHCSYHHYGRFHQCCIRNPVVFLVPWHTGHVVCVHQDTEFPGVVVRPIGEFRSTVDYQYQLLRCNVDLLKIIQLGLTFMNEDGDYPPGTTTWQFNFKFNLTWVFFFNVLLLIQNILSKNRTTQECFVSSIQRRYVLAGFHRFATELRPPV